MKKLKIASFFAGVGGIDLAFEQTEAFEVIYANEMDPYAVKTYENNFKLKVDCRKIEDVKLNEIPKFDVMIGGFPCTSFSLAGYRKGFEDKRTGHLYFELERIFKNKKPKIIFLENVKSLVGHDGGKTFRVILDSLEQEGYKVKPMVMNACEYGNIPQNRERIYIVCFRDKKLYEKFNFPLPVPLTKTIHDIIDFVNKSDDKYYYTKGKYKGDIYEKLVEAMDDEDAVYQWRRQYVRKNKSGVVPTLTANQGEGGHNVCLIRTKYGIRKMTPHECFNTQGYPLSYKLPEELSDSKLYKQAGNSVAVPVINRIAQNIADIL
ncbi:DNA cytosine methyltransferase [Clostridium algidicarnis]|uniref:DNA cytosine methyltransferase n=1 Tax=Clostridium algidicarnis TaxID=37659 RepID=UPI003FD7EBFC